LALAAGRLATARPALSGRTLLASTAFAPGLASLLEQLLAYRTTVVDAICLAVVTGHLEVDLALLEINPRDLHANRVAQTEYPPGTLAGQRVLYGIEVVVVRRQGGDVHQSLDVDASQLDEQAEAGHRGDQAIETL